MWKNSQSADLLKFEKELLGFYITSHPLTEHQIPIERYTTSTTKESMSLGEGAEVTIGGMITQSKKFVTKTGRSAGMPWIKFFIEDLDGQLECLMFADTYAEMLRRAPNAIANEQIGFVKGRVDRKRETPSIMVNDFIPVEDAVGRLTTAMALKLDPTRHDDTVIVQMKPLLQKYKGGIRVYMQLQTGESKTVLLQLGRELSVRPAKELVDDLETLLGHGSVQLKGDGSRRLKRLEQQKLFAESQAEVEPTDAEVPAAEVLAEGLLLEESIDSG